MIWLNAPGIRKHRIGGLVIRKMGRSFDGLLEMVQNVKTFVFQVKSHRKAFIVEKALSIQMDKMAHSVDVSQPFFSLSSAISVCSGTLRTWWPECRLWVQ
jgi:hypothetical protein